MRSIIVSVLFGIMGCASERAPGTPGEMGSAGLVGPTGPQGPAGPQGVQGPAGPTGPQGAQGPAGPTGAQGPAGSAGAAGTQGPAGAMGLTGPQGPIGAQGPTGATGAKGATGAAGARGPAAIVFSTSNVQLGILLSATPGSEAYLSFNDGLTLVNDGLIVPMARQKVWYTNNDCTGTPYVAETFGYEPIAQVVYVGFNNAMFTASTTVFAASLVVQSFSTGGGGCTVQSIAPKVHALTSVGTPTDLATSLPWHVVVQ